MLDRDKATAERHHHRNRPVLVSMIVVCSLLLFSPPVTAGADTSSSTLSMQLGDEMILFQEIPSVYTASKHEQKTTKAPSSVSIITASEIERYGYRTLADILKSIMGFHVTYDRNYSYVSVRGFGRPGDYNTGILLLVDGHRINDNIYDYAPLGTDFLLDTDLIDRIEVIRGPGSSLYGTSAFLAVINVITKAGRDLKAVEVSAEAASFDTRRGRFTYGDRFDNGLEMLISASLHDSDGQDLYYKEFDDPSTNNGTAQGCDYDRGHSFFSKISFRDFTLRSAFASRDKGIPTASYETVFNDPRNRTVDKRGYLEMEYGRYFRNGLEMTVRAAYDYYEYTGDYIYDDPQPDTLNKDYGKGEWLTGEVKFMKDVRLSHKLIIGTEYQYNFRQDQANYDESPYLLYFEDTRDSANWALYLQDEVKLIERVTVNIGMRYDHYETFGESVNPRLGLIYNPAERTTVKVLYGEAFRAPNVYELYYNDLAAVEPTQKGNPRLKPETIKTCELVLEKYIGKNIRGVVSAFHFKIDDLITLQEDPADGLSVYTNVDRTETDGIEVELEGKWMNNIEGRISYTFQESENTQTGKVLPNSPRHLAKLNLTTPLAGKKLLAGLECQYTSNRKTLDDNDTGSVLITNLTMLSRNLVEGLKVSLGVYNLFNRNYGDPGSPDHEQDIIKQDGRTYRFKITYAF